VTGHKGTGGNETADQLARLGSGCPFVSSEPAGTAKKAVKDWTNTDHQKYWESLTGNKQAKEFLQGELC
jgi:hypothetical protein